VSLWQSGRVVRLVPDPRPARARVAASPGLLLLALRDLLRMLFGPA
jgi:hypothetical protein